MALSSKARRKQLRERLLRAGASYPEIADEMCRQFRVRRRTGWRYALGWEMWKVAQEYTVANPGARVDVPRISRWESWPVTSGSSRPSLDHLAGLAMAFGHGCTVADLVDDADLAEFSAAERRVIAAVTRSGADGAASGGISQVEEDLAERVRMGVADPARYADAGLVDAFRLQLETAKAVDGRFGAAAALPTTLGVVGTVRSVLPEVREGTRERVLALGAEAAEFAGWLFRDLANAEQARYWYDQAMGYAQLCGDGAMQGFVLLRKSQMAYESRSARQVHLFADAALAGPWRLSPRLQAEAVLQVAKGRIMIGQYVDVDGVVERAREVAECQDRLLDVREATCWFEAGEPDRAVELYDTALAGDLSQRDRAFFSARRSAALARAGQADDAAVGAIWALGGAQQAGSSRTAGVVRGVLTDLTPWRERPAVEELASALTSHS